jgi:hypothetical protein
VYLKNGIDVVRELPVGVSRISYRRVSQHRRAAAQDREYEEPAGE